MRDANARDEDVELEPDLRAAVNELHGRIEHLDHYAVLGVEKTADRKAIKRAYYEGAAKFHPDKHFRKKLGPYKVKMEAIFARMTLAHDALSDREKRAEYDAYLQARSRSRTIEELLADALAEVRRVEENVEQQARISSPHAAPGGSIGASSAPAPAAASRRPAGASSAPAPQGAPSASSSRAPGGRSTAPTAASAAPSKPTVAVDVGARRDALARRLLGSRPPSAGANAGAAASGSAPSGAPAQPQPSPTDAMDALRRRYEERVLHAKAAQARKYTEKANAAAVAGDHVAAANALRVASGLVPNDADVQQLARDAQAKADVILGQTYTQQAEYEEKNGHWVEAARSWARACRARPGESRAHERAANALLKAEGDLHEAARLGQRACELDTASARARATLASVYLAAGLTLNARRELETAAQLAPHDDSIREMIQKLGKTA